MAHLALAHEANWPVRKVQLHTVGLRLCHWHQASVTYSVAECDVILGVSPCDSLSPGPFDTVR